MPSRYTYDPAVDFGQLFADDWTKAQRRALDSGYDEATADALYLAPTRAKWKIIGSNPEDFQKPDKLRQINEEFDTATQSAVKSLSREEPAQQTAIAKFGPLVQRWTVAAAKPTMSFEQQETVKNLSQEINRLKSKRGTYTRELTNANLDDVSKANKNAAVEGINSELADLQAEYERALRGGTQPEPAPETIPTPFARPAQRFVAPAETPAVPALLGTGQDIQAPSPAPFAERLSDMAAQAGLVPPPPPTRRGLTFISGRPDLSNVTREEADAAWAARFGQMPKPTAPAPSPPLPQIESEAQYASAAEVRAAYKSGRLDRDQAVQILKDQFGLE